ncbi:MAG: glycosyltransferase [Halopseudomonas sp.]
MTAPIAIFVYNRPSHTRRTIEALASNFLSSDSDLIVYSDAAKTSVMKSAVDEVRAYLATVTGFKSVQVRERTHNFGLAKSIIGGVTEVLQKEDRVIVLEDDMITSPYFLTYMNQALERYEHDERVASIHGYVYPMAMALPEAFFLPGADCWGWATWRKGWACFNADGQFLLNELEKHKLINEFDYNGSYPYSKMLQDQVNGLNDSWAVRWYASAFLAGKLTLYPGRSLVHNIGNDNSGTHCGEASQFDAVLARSSIDLNSITVEPCLKGRAAFEEFFRASQAGRSKRLLMKMKYLMLRPFRWV